jgi:hypothetical protein
MIDDARTTLAKRTAPIRSKDSARILWEITVYECQKAPGECKHPRPERNAADRRPHAGYGRNRRATDLRIGARECGD